MHVAPNSTCSQYVDFNVGGISAGFVVGTFEANLAEVISIFELHQHIATTVWTGIGTPLVPGLFSRVEQILWVFLSCPPAIANRVLAFHVVFSFV